MAEIKDPRTSRDYICIGSTATRVGLVFTTFEYYVCQSDFDRLCTGKQPVRMVYRGKNCGRPSGARAGGKTRVHAQLMDVWRDEQRAATYGARECEAAWRL